MYRIQENLNKTTDLTNFDGSLPLSELYHFDFIFTAVSDNTQPAMGLFCDVNQNLKKSPWHLSSGPLRKQKVKLFWFEIGGFQSVLYVFKFVEISRMFLKSVKFYLYTALSFLSSVYWNIASIDFSYRASKSRRNTDMGGWKRIGTFSLTFTFAASARSLLPP